MPKTDNVNIYIRALECDDIEAQAEASKLSDSGT